MITTLSTGPKALLRLVRQRWFIASESHWVRDVRLGGDGYRSSEVNGIQLLALLHTLALNLPYRCQRIRRQ
ncbi:MAG: hypothetical protein NTV57_06605 [Cyanobacteria bacterium]|nr:hypothetical protein [Cyanobacteriota bacterium]